MGLKRDIEIRLLYYKWAFMDLKRDIGSRLFYGPTFVPSQLLEDLQIFFWLECMCCFNKADVLDEVWNTWWKFEELNVESNSKGKISKAKTSASRSKELVAGLAVEKLHNFALNFEFEKYVTCLYMSMNYAWSRMLMYVLQAIGDIFWVWVHKFWTFHRDQLARKSYKIISSFQNTICPRFYYPIFSIVKILKS